MTVLGYGITDRDPIYGWEAVKSNSRPVVYTLSLAGRVWQVRDNLIEQGLDEGRLEHEQIEMLTHLAVDLENIGCGRTPDCHCVLPEQHCPTCTTIARAIYILQEMGD